MRVRQEKRVNLYEENTFCRRFGPTMNIIQAIDPAVRYEIQKFSTILNANNTALAVIAQLQEQLGSDRPLSYAFIVSKITTLLAETYKMVRSINELSSNRYDNLFRVYANVAASISGKLGENLSGRTNKTIAGLVIPFSDLDSTSVDAVGEKISFLCDIKNKTGSAVPDGFAVTDSAYDLLMKENDLYPTIDALVRGMDTADMESVYRASSALQQLILHARIPDALHKAVQDAVKVLKAHGVPDLRVSVRSSALFESNVYTSFAGQYRTELNVAEEDIEDAYLRVLAGKYTPEAMIYASLHGYDIRDIRMCVGVQQMVDARTSGIMYTRWQGYRQIMIQSVYGLGLYIVNGSLVPDTFIFDSRLNRILSRRTGEKPVMLICDRYGTREQRVPADRSRAPSLENDQIVALAAIGERLSQIYRMPLDIEWAIDARSNIAVLQCRRLLPAYEYEERDEDPYGFDIEWAIDEQGEPYILDYIQGARQKRGTTRAGAVQGIPNAILIDGGITASAGVAAGTAYNVNNELERMQFPSGALIITRTAHPRLAVLLKRAVGIIAERGDVTGHLATVARELGMPALFGTGSMDLADGTVMTLDATGRKVYQGIVQDLATAGSSRRMTPVQMLLESLLKDSAVLHTPNPSNSNAQAMKCKTIHDIIRFVHQIAIEEMFKTCDSKVAKGCRTRRIISPVPMELIAFDLGGGISEHAPEGDVPLEFVVCVPMRALWSGMTHRGIKWSGERNINLSGLLSAMTNYMVDEGAEMRGLGAPSYVFISDRYMNFNSRVGYHFATIDALVGAQQESNYINFRFSGGANALDRRSRRAMLIEKILRDAEFVCVRTLDTVTAHLRNRDAGHMQTKLEHLGRLLGFVNRLDIAMVTDGDIDKYYRAFKDQRYSVL